MNDNNTSSSNGLPTANLLLLRPDSDTLSTQGGLPRIPAPVPDDWKAARRNNSFWIAARLAQQYARLTLD